MKAAVGVLILLALVLTGLTGFWDEVSSSIFPRTTWGLYSREFFEGVILNAHGTLLDILILSIVLVWFDQRSKGRVEKNNAEMRRREESMLADMQKQAAITRHIESLADLMHYPGEDISYRTWSVIKRLFSLGVHNFSCAQATLNKIQIKNLVLKGADMRAINVIDSDVINMSLSDTNCEAANFSKSKFDAPKFSGVDFRRAKFCHADLRGVDFSSCVLKRADFTGAILKSAVFKNVDCEGVNFADADLRSANFIGAKNLTQAMLNSAKSAAYVQV